MRKLKKILKVLILVVVAAAVLGYVTMRLWNWLMPEIFGLGLITFWQAVGLLLLSKVLLGGIHNHGSRGGGRSRWEQREWKRHMKERWEGMSPDERERFRAAMKDKWGKHCGPLWMRGDRGWGKESRFEHSEEKDEVKG